jgi:hypothetical protein
MRYPLCYDHQIAAVRIATAFGTGNFRSPEAARATGRNPNAMASLLTHLNDQKVIHQVSRDKVGRVWAVKPEFIEHLNTSKWGSRVRQGGF